MKTILSYSQISKKYSPSQEEKLKNIFISLSNSIEDIIKKNPNFIDHSKAVKEILSATFWVFVVIFTFILSLLPNLSLRVRWKEPISMLWSSKKRKSKITTIGGPYCLELAKVYRNLL